jgi:hypothetical protein
MISILCQTTIEKEADRHRCGGPQNPILSDCQTVRNSKKLTAT